MKIVSFNVNGIRARLHQLRAICEHLDPDILAVQEIKVQDQDFPQHLAIDLGYHVHYYGQKSHYGVAIFSKLPPLSVQFGLGSDTPATQRRLITANFATTDKQHLTVINGYFPQGGNRNHPLKFAHKQTFYNELLNHITATFTPTQLLLVVGDMNIAPLNVDVGIGATNAARWLRDGACGFLPEEREWLQQLTDWGLQDLFRHCYPQIADRFSWFDYRSHGFTAEPKRGLRLDLILATLPLVERCQNAGIDYTSRAMEHPSDHCPVWADINLHIAAPTVTAQHFSF